MSEACKHLHSILAKLPRLRAGFDPETLPQNGLYFLFENGESGHGGARIVRVGTHTGQNNLIKRIREHLFAANKGRSVFRKHIGRCLLSKTKDPFLHQWEIDLTTKKAKEKYGLQIDKDILRKTEEAVTKFMNENFSFVIHKIEEKVQRLDAEKHLLSTIAQCTECSPSQKWLGLHHPNPIIRESGLWNIQGINEASASKTDIEKIFEH